MDATCYSLLSNKLFQQIHCDLHIHKPTDLYGSCTWEDTNIRPRDFTIEVHKEMDEKNFIMTTPVVETPSTATIPLERS